MLHQSQKEWQIGFANTLLIQRQDKTATIRLQMEVGILHALRNALEAAGAADVVTGEKFLQILKGNVGIDGHVRLTSTRAGR